MKPEWKDSTPYRRGERGQVEPSSFTISFGDIRITVTKGHIHHPGKWVVVCSLVGREPYELKECETPHEAKDKAITLVGLKVKALDDAIWTIERAAS